MKIKSRLCDRVNEISFCGANACVSRTHLTGAEMKLLDRGRSSCSPGSSLRCNTVDWQLVQVEHGSFDVLSYFSRLGPNAYYEMKTCPYGVGIAQWEVGIHKVLDFNDHHQVDAGEVKERLKQQLLTFEAAAEKYYQLAHAVEAMLKRVERDIAEQRKGIRSSGECVFPPGREPRFIGPLDPI